MSHGGAMRYSQYGSSGGSGAASAPQQQQQQHPNGSGGQTASTQPGSPPHVPSLPFMRPPMQVTSSGASMLLPPPPPGPPPPSGPPGANGGGLPKYPGSPIGSLSGSDTDVSTSNEHLSREERYVLSHARVEPQGEENLQGSVTPVNEMQGRFIGDKFAANTSADSTARYATPTASSSSRSISESRTGGGNGGGGVLMYANIGTIVTAAGGPESGVPSNRSSMVGPGSNRNSLKEPNSNRSSMDVSQSSYNTLIIHDDIYCSVASSGGGRDFAASPPPYMVKKERPRSYGEAAVAVATSAQTPMHDISELTEEYISQSHVLKHLAKEVKLSRGGPATTPSRQQSAASASSERNANNGRKEEDKAGKGPPPPRGGGGRRGSEGGGGGGAKAKSKSQPDLSRLYDIDPEEVEALVKENHLLKQQLNSCYLKVAKSQKLEQEIANIYRVHEELVQSCDRRERLERAARTRLQQDCRRLQELNRAFRDQVEVYQSQLHNSSDHQLGRTQQDVLISQLVNQNKSLVDANRRQCIELQAQNATLEEQRIHINVLDTALKRLEEECRQKQVYVERCAQLQHALQSLQNASERREQAERKLRIDYDSELPNRSGSSTNSETDTLKWQLREKDAQILRLESECAKLEQRNLEESNVRNVAKLAMERNAQETERILAEAKQEKIRYLDEAHAANRKVTELQARLKLVENRLAEKDAMMRAYQGQKIYGGSTNSYGSYNLSTDSFALNPLGAYGSPASYVDVSTCNSYDVGGGGGAGGSLLVDPSVPYGANVAAAVAVSSYASSSPYGGGPPNPSSFVQSSLNLPTGGGGVAMSGGVPYSSPSSSSTSNYSSTGHVGGGGGLGMGTGSEHTLYDAKSYDAQRKSIDDQLKQLDEQLLSKRGLCCFPSLSAKKPIQSLLADEVSVLSANNSEAFLQNLAAHMGSADRRSEQPGERDPGAAAGSQKAEEMVLLEKQGRCSQKLRGGSSSGSSAGATLLLVGAGNLAHVSHAVGQNMTDISNIGGAGGGGGNGPHTGTGGGGGVAVGASGSPGGGNKVPKLLSHVSQQGAAGGGLLGSPKGGNADHRGSSLPPSALPRPPRSLKPPRKIEYGRLSDGGGEAVGGGGRLGTGKKTRAVTPPSPASSSGGASQKDGLLYGGGGGGGVSSCLLKHGRDFSPAKGSGGGGGGNHGYLELKDTLQLTKEYGTLRHKAYGSMTAVAPPSPGGGGPKFGFGKVAVGSDPSTKNYQRLEEPNPNSPAAHLHNSSNHNSQSSSQSSQSRKSSTDSSTLKRSLLPNVGRKQLPAPGMGPAGKGGGSRDSLNSASSGSNHSANPPGPPAGTGGGGLPRSSPQPAGGYQQQHQHQHHHHHQQQHQHTRTPPRFMQQQHQQHQHQQHQHQHQQSSSMGGHPGGHPAQPPLHHGFFAKFPSPSQHAASPARTTTATATMQPPKTSSSLPSSSILHAAASSSATSAIGQSSTASLPPKPSTQDKASPLMTVNSSSSHQQQQQQRRGSSLARVENKYRIQF